MADIIRLADTIEVLAWLDDVVNPLSFFRWRSRDPRRTSGKEANTRKRSLQPRGTKLQWVRLEHEDGVFNSYARLKSGLQGGFETRL
jgi:hypothetical protein